MAQAVVPSRINVEVLRGNPARLRRERVMRGLFFSAAFLSVVISVGIVVSLAGGALDFLRKVPLSTLWSDGWFPRNNLFDIKTIVAGTLIVAGIAMIVAVPLGLGAALYLAEYASPRARRWLKPILETLASVPSVVMGFFAICDHQPGPRAEAVRLGRPALQPPGRRDRRGTCSSRRSSPPWPRIRCTRFRTRCARPRTGWGHARRATSIRVVVPAAVSGITAAILLGISRAIGETMIVAIVAGGTGGSLFNAQPPQARADHDGRDHGAGDRIRFGPRRRAAYPSLFFVGLLLFLMTLGLNLLSERFVRRVRGGF